MTDIKSYSKEWIVSNATQKQKDAFAKISSEEMKELNKKGGLTSQTFNYDLLVGSKEEIISKYNVLKQSEKNEKECDLIEKFGGIENVIDIIDKNGDKKITKEEFLELAGYDTGDWAYSNNIVLSAKDMYDVYTNVDLAQNATVEKDGQKTIYKYEDGSKTTIERDKNGDVISKVENETFENQNTKITNYDYVNKVKTETTYNDKGQETNLVIDKPGRKDDISISTVYYTEDMTAKIVTTVGRSGVSLYDNEGNIIGKNEVFNYVSDGVIEGSKQGSIGDCWALSQVNTLRTTDIGKQIIKDAIHKNEDGTVTVTLKGSGRSYTFTPEEICSREYMSSGKLYSSGDDDMKILELAFTEERKHVLETQEKEYIKKNISDKATMDDPLRAGYDDEIIKLLTGIQPEYVTKSEKKEAQLEKIMQDNNRYTMVTAFKIQTTDFGVTESGDEKITTDHQYSISRVTEDTVYVVNPWDSNEEIAYPKTRFLKDCKYTSLADMNEYKQ